MLEGQKESERYSRQLLFAPLGAPGQARLAAARLAIVGCGALGTAQADLLTRAGVGHLRLIDRDYVEPSNLQRQTLYDETDAAAATPKAIAAQARLRRVNSEISIEAHVADLVPGNIETLLADCDLILDGTDNAETRYLINDFAVAHAIPWIYGAAVGARGMSFTILPGETACLACLFSDAGDLGGETCDTAGVLGWVVAQVAAVEAGEAVKLLIGARAALRASLWTLDAWTNAWRETSPPPRDPECRACVRRDFVHLRGEGRADVTFCGRNTVQIHEHHRPLALDALAARLRPHGTVRDNAFALRFLPAQPPGFELTVFPDGRALIKGTTDAAVARSLYARYIGT